MSFLRLYRRVVALLAPERGLAITLVLANVGLATAAFLGPLLFGRIVDALASSSVHPSHETWQRILFFRWRSGARSASAVSAPNPSPSTPTGWRTGAGWRRWPVLRTCAEPASGLPQRNPLRPRAEDHAGRGVDNLFGVWLSFFRETLATFVAFRPAAAVVAAELAAGALLVVLIALLVGCSPGS